MNGVLNILQVNSQDNNEFNWRHFALVSLMLILNTFSLRNIPNINIVLPLFTLNIFLPAVLVKGTDSETTVSKITNPSFINHDLLSV